MIRYNFQDVDPDNVDDMFRFVEAEIQAPLQNWQKDLLISMLNGITYIGGRGHGRKAIIEAYTKWMSSQDEETICCPCEFTYDQLMQGIPVGEDTGNQTIV